MALGLMENSPQYVHILPGDNMPDVATKPSRVLVVLDQLVCRDWQGVVSAWLIKIGCLYMLAWGPGCSGWDDSVDFANSEAFDHGEIPEGSDAMTTWHDNDTLEEYMWFAKNCAMHSLIELERTLILHIGSSSRESEILEAYAEA